MGGFCRPQSPLAACAEREAALLHGIGLPKDPRRARLLYEQVRTAMPVMCGNLAGLYLRGQGGPKDARRAAGLYRTGCDAGSSPACDNLGLLYNGPLRHQDWRLDRIAIALLESGQ